MGRRSENYFISVCGDCIKLTYVSSVPEPGEPVSERRSEGAKSLSNINRAKKTFAEIGYCNPWEYMATFTSASADPSKDIRGVVRWLQKLNSNHGWSIKYLLIFEVGSEGGRLHAHALLSGVPADFVRCYSASEYARLPRAVKLLYSQYKTDTGTRLAYCPLWKKGWSTLVPVDGSPKVVSYMTKYMTKGNIEFTTQFGKRSFFASAGLNRPEKQKVPADIAGTMWRRVPPGTWFTCYWGDNGLPISSCYVVDRDKIAPALWNYYTSIFGALQEGIFGSALESLASAPVS